MSLGVFFGLLNLKKNLFHSCLSVLFVSGAYSLRNNTRITYKMPSSGLSPMDPNSFSRPDLAVVTNIFMALDINFTRRVISGNTDLTVQKVDQKVEEVILDIKDLNIEAIYETQSNIKLDYKISETGPFGSKLTVALPDKNLENYIISVRYETSPNASGLQWLNPEHTAGKKFPFVFSQFQAIHARSVIPCQDTPSVKTKYTAVISVPKDLTVVMSAINKHKKPLLERTMYAFEQNIPVQSYLIALAAGELESREIGPRSKVWAEKQIVDAAAFEFSDTERQLKTAEDICGPYVWGIYDLLVLPPSFPFGGMENPCLTFVTPTLLAGDRSLANVVAHEIAHSWTGNLVTNANFEHFWLNEGFTMFIERKVLGRLQGVKYEDFHAYEGYLELQETVNRMGEKDPLTKLVLNLEGVHPDDSFSLIPYEKGYIFLRYLQSLVGITAFESFLKTYFETYKYKSIKTSDFQEYFKNHFKSNTAITKIDWDTWLYGTGMPPIIPDYDQTLRNTCQDYIKQFISWNGQDSFPISSQDIAALIPDQKIHFLRLILKEEPQSLEKLRGLETAFDLANVKNSEMKFLWFRICIKGRWEEKIEGILSWLNGVGRMKYTRPLYRDLYNWEASKTTAINNFEKYRSYMMHVSEYTIAKDLHLLK
ncbi:leukotriene A-4 hydrolase-like [Onthophagus taurus]|uniref:leukotriene A-4 hydrolase-like n=1 Tax=Onthophagus taurus TaxID=166361 RepID=UPI0039BE29F1